MSSCLTETAQIPPLFPNLRPDWHYLLKCSISFLNFDYQCIYKAWNCFISKCYPLCSWVHHWEGSTEIRDVFMYTEAQIVLVLFSCIINVLSKSEKVWAFEQPDFKESWNELLVCEFVPSSRQHTQNSTSFHTHEASSFIFESYLEFKSLSLISRICLLLRWHMQGFCLLDISVKRFATNLFFTLWRALSANGIVVINEMKCPFNTPPETHIIC